MYIKKKSLKNRLKRLIITICKYNKNVLKPIQSCSLTDPPANVHLFKSRHSAEGTFYFWALPYFFFCLFSPGFNTNILIGQQLPPTAHLLTWQIVLNKTILFFSWEIWRFPPPIPHQDLIPTHIETNLKVFFSLVTSWGRAIRCQISCENIYMFAWLSH